MSSPAVRALGLSKRYGSKEVLKSFSIEVEPGERFCLVGANGSGKTTLLEILVGLKKPSAGEVEVLGLKPTDPRLKGRRAILLDRASFSYFAKVKEVVWLYSSFCRRPVDTKRMLTELELDDEAYVRHLSKGQKQRLGLLLTLLDDPQLILLDEPTSGLDPQARLKLWELLHQRLASDNSHTLIFASHDLPEAERWADRVAILHRGELIAVDSPEKLCRSTLRSQRKLTLVGEVNGAPERWRNDGLVETVKRLGAETVFYTDRPEQLLDSLPSADAQCEIRIESVSLRDAFFQLTGSMPHAGRPYAR